MAGGEYGRVARSFWTDPDIKRPLTPDQKTLLLYWFTSPHGNMIGLFHCPFDYAASETGLPIAQVRELTLGVLSKFVTYDERTEEILVHNAGRHQVGRSAGSRSAMRDHARPSQRGENERVLPQARRASHGGWLRKVALPRLRGTVEQPNRASHDHPNRGHDE